MTRRLRLQGLGEGARKRRTRWCLGGVEGWWPAFGRLAEPLGARRGVISQHSRRRPDGPGACDNSAVGDARQDAFVEICALV